ncbi:MAG: family 20 glycosylhydrolase, partial [Propionibacteriaceae bacterium]|nr:family 20 glycosylhydrolase [Propionibacteriaceae bacterium]
MRLRSTLIGAATAVALITASLVPTTSSANPLPEAPPVALADVSLPPTIPSLDGWTAATDGTWTLGATTKIVAPADLSAQVDILAAELDVYLNPSNAQTTSSPATPGAIPVATTGADADDIAVVLDTARTAELGAEGYELEIAADGLTITAADKRGAFYGTRSVSQLLRQQLTLPAGSVIDMPKYEQRGVTLCACVINIQPDFIDRLLADMSDLKLNHLLLEMKLETDDVRNNFWSYYTKDDVSDLVAKAGTYGIDVIPEINSPGHMGIWLKNRPDLQLKNNAGNRSSSQLDISHPDAFAFYTHLIDQYSDVFTTDYWHMGADEYMIGTSFSNYNDLTAWAKAEYGATATIGDAFIAFINQVNAYVKAKDKHLRVWNDGIINTQVVQLDTDIVVEYWDGAGIRPATLIERGYELMNANGALYWSRANTFFKMNSQALWNNNWNVGKFPGSNGNIDPDNPNILGAKVSIWPDDSWYQTENEVEAEIFDGFRFISQMTWQGNHHDADGKDMTWNQFKAGIDSINRNPLWLNVHRRPLLAGTYPIKLAGGDSLVASGTNVSVTDGDDTWTIKPTADHYYQLRSTTTDTCLAMFTGEKSLGVVTEIGAKPEMKACADMSDTARATSNARNTQKWQIIPTDGGFTVRNALSNQDLSTILGTEKSIDFSANRATDTTLSDQSLRPANGTLVQLPNDKTSAAWVFTREAGAFAEAEGGLLIPGETTTVTVTVGAASGSGLEDVVITPATAAGFTFEPATVTIGAIGAGENKVATFQVSGGPASGVTELTFNVTHAGGTLSAAVNVETTCGPAFTPTAIAADSQQLTGEPAPSGPFAAAFDGNPNTYWHTAWSPSSTPYPHWVTMDAGESKNLCSLNYLPRQNSPNGRVKGYNVYVSDNGTDWGTAVATGELPNTGSLHRIALPLTQSRYVKFEGVSAFNNEKPAVQDPWMTAGEISLTGKVPTVEPTPSVTPSAT